MQWMSMNIVAGGIGLMGVVIGDHGSWAGGGVDRKGLMCSLSFVTFKFSKL
jgi:hypothetical protein